LGHDGNLIYRILGLVGVSILISISTTQFFDAEAFEIELQCVRMLGDPIPNKRGCHMSGFPRIAPAERCVDIEVGNGELLVYTGKNDVRGKEVHGVTEMKTGCEEKITVKFRGTMILSKSRPVNIVMTASPGTLSSSGEIIIEPGGTLIIQNGAKLVNNGPHESFLAGTITNHGTIRVQSGGHLENGNDAVLNNYGKIELEQGSEFKALGPVNNHKDFSVAGKVINTHHNFINHGTLNIFSAPSGPPGYFQSEDASIENHGSIDVGGVLYLEGPLNNYKKLKISTPGVISNWVKLTNKAGATISNFGTLSNDDATTWRGAQSQVLNECGSIYLGSDPVGTFAANFSYCPKLWQSSDGLIYAVSPDSNTLSHGEQISCYPGDKAISIGGFVQDNSGVLRDHYQVDEDTMLIKQRTEGDVLYPAMVCVKAPLADDIYRLSVGSGSGLFDVHCHPGDMAISATFWLDHMTGIRESRSIGGQYDVGDEWWRIATVNDQPIHDVQLTCATGDFKDKLRVNRIAGVSGTGYHDVNCYVLGERGLVLGGGGAAISGGFAAVGQNGIRESRSISAEAWRFQAVDSSSVAVQEIHTICYQIPEFVQQEFLYPDFSPISSIDFELITSQPANSGGNLAHQGGPAEPAAAFDVIPGYPDIHNSIFANDGIYGNEKSWIGNSANSWLQIDLGEIKTIDTVAFGRDRQGQYDDRDPGQYTIEVATIDGQFSTVVDSSQLGFSGQINGAETITVNFNPVKAKFVKLTFENLGAAIDEVEVFGPEPKITRLPASESTSDVMTNANLAYQGGAASPATAFDVIPGYPDIHNPIFANDGVYGNAKSWIGNSQNSWLQIDLGTSQEIDTVAFGRDRLGTYDDRDPGQFTIEVAQAGGQFSQVVNSAQLSFDGQINGDETLQVNFNSVLAQFVKLTFVNHGAAIDEVEVFGPETTSRADSDFFDEPDPSEMEVMESKVLRPTQQVSQGISAEEVTCKEGLQKLYKSADGAPICVTESGAERLIKMGWAS